MFSRGAQGCSGDRLSRGNERWLVHEPTEHEDGLCVEDKKKRDELVSGSDSTE